MAAHIGWSVPDRDGHFGLEPRLFLQALGGLVLHRQLKIADDLVRLGRVGLVDPHQGDDGVEVHFQDLAVASLRPADGVDIGQQRVGGPLHGAVAHLQGAEAGVLDHPVGHLHQAAVQAAAGADQPAQGGQLDRDGLAGQVAFAGVRHFHRIGAAPRRAGIVQLRLATPVRPNIGLADHKGPGLAQHQLDPRQQGRGREGLQHELVDAGLAGQLHVQQRRLAGDHDDGDFRTGDDVAAHQGRLADSLRKGQAVHVGHHPVGEDDVRVDRV